jgi:hypothetical protein
MNIKTSSDTFVFHVTVEADGDLPSNDKIEYQVRRCLFHWFNVIDNTNPINVIGVAMEPLSQTQQEDNND